MISPPPSPPIEVIEDSEPEREQRRLEFKQRKREERKLKKQQQLKERIKNASGSRSSGTGEGFSPAGSSTGGGTAGDVSWEEEGEPSSSRPAARPSPFSSLSPVAITTKPIDFSSYAYPKSKLKASGSSSSSVVPMAAPAAATTSSYFPPRASTSSTSLSLEPRRSKSKSVEIIEPTSECTFKDVEMRRLKKCVLCGEDWSQPGKKSRTKWAHIVNCTPSPSHSTVCDLIREYLDVTKAGGKEPRSLLEKKMFDLKEEEAAELWDAGSDVDDVVVIVDPSKLGKGKERARASRSISKVSSLVASVRAPGPEDDQEEERSPSPCRSPSPLPEALALASTFISPFLTMAQHNHFANFAYSGAPSTTSNGGVKPRAKSAVPKAVVPDCTIRDVEMRKVKSCLFCQEDWSTGKKAVKVKWAHLYNCSLLATPPLSLALLTTQIVTHLAAPEPKTLLESLTMKKQKAKRGKGPAATSLVLPAGNEVARESVMRNLENVMGEGGGSRRGGDEEELEDDEELRLPPSTQAFGTSGLGARFGGRGKSEVRTEENGAGPSRLGGHSSEEEDESESGSSMDEDEEADAGESSARDADRLRTSLWGIAADSTATQIGRAGSENILSPPSSPPPKPLLPPLVTTSTVISLSSTSSSDSLRPPVRPPPIASTSYESISDSSSESSKARAAARQRTRTPDAERSRRSVSEEEGRGEASSISQVREQRKRGKSSREGGEGESKEGGGEEEDGMRTTSSTRTKRHISIISIDDRDDDDDLPDTFQDQQHRNTSRNNAYELDDNNNDNDLSPSPSQLFSDDAPSHDPSRRQPEPFTSSGRPKEEFTSVPDVDFWSNAPPPHASSSRLVPPAHSTPARRSDLGPTSQHYDQEVIDLLDEEDDWGQEAVLRWDGGGDDHPPRDASSEDEVQCLDPAPPTQVNASYERSFSVGDRAVVVVEDDEEEGDDPEPYDQSDDRWGDEGVLVWDAVVGDGDEEIGVEGGVAEDEIFDVIDEEDEDEVEVEEPRRVEPTSKKNKTSAPAKRPKAKKKKKKTPIMPEYDDMPIATLQNIMRTNYGIKPPSSRPQLLRLLREYWWIANPLPSTSASEEEEDLPSASLAKRSAQKKKAAATASRKGRAVIDSDSDGQQPRSEGKGKARAVSVEEEEEVDSDVPLAESPRKKRATSSQVADGLVVPLEQLPAVFMAMIVENEDLWLRMLRYEPIDFQELTTCFHQRKIKTKGWQTALKKWLDSQSLTYYTEEQTGSRRRH